MKLQLANLVSEKVKRGAHLAYHVIQKNKKITARFIKHEFAHTIDTTSDKEHNLINVCYF